MEEMVRKYQQRFRKVRDDMSRWDLIQSRLLTQFANASAVIQRLQVIQDPKNFGSLELVDGIQDVLLAKQIESLQMTILSMKNTIEDFGGVVTSLEKIYRDGRQLVKGNSNQSAVKQLQQRIGVKPTLADCLEGLRLLHEMHKAEFLLKSSIISAVSSLTLKPRFLLISSIISAVSSLTLKPSANDLRALQQLLVDQPNIPTEELQCIFDIIFAEDIC